MTQNQPRQAITKRCEMSGWEALIHAVLMLCTFGLWTPVYLARKKEIRRKTITTFIN